MHKKHAPADDLDKLLNDPIALGILAEIEVDERDLRLPQGDIDLGDLEDLSEPAKPMTPPACGPGAASTPAPPIAAARTGSTQPVTIRVAVSVLAQFRTLAATLGVPYQKLMKRAMQEWITARRAGPPT